MTDTARLNRFLATRDTSLDATFWNDFIALLETRFGAIEQVTVGYTEAKDALVERGLTQVAAQLALIVDELNTTVTVAQADLLNQVAQAQGEAQAVADTVAAMQATIDAVGPALAALEGQIADIIVNNNLPSSAVTISAIAGLTATDAQAAFAELVGAIDAVEASAATAVSDAADAVAGLATHAGQANPHGVTAAQVGAYTAAQVDAIITALKGGATEALDTLEEIGTALVARGLKAGETWTGAHDFGAATVTLPPATSVLGATLIARGSRVRTHNSASVNTTSNSFVDAFSGPETPRQFAAAGDVSVKATFAGEVYTYRTSGSSTGGDVEIQYRLKQGGAWGAWATIADANSYQMASAAGVTSFAFRCHNSASREFVLPAAATDYQIKLRYRANSGSTILVGENSYLETQEFAA